MMLDRLKSLDLILLASVLGLLSIGLLAIYSTSQSGGDTNYFASQLKWIFLGLGIMVVAAFLPNRLYYEISYPLYGLSLILLVVVLFWGTAGYGATRWIRLGGFGFQPSEFAKITTVLALARFLSDERWEINRPKNFAVASLIIALPFLLIAKQPDLGTGLVFVMLALPIFYWVGLNTVSLVLIVAPAVAFIASFNIYAFVVVMLLVLFFLYQTRIPLLRSAAYTVSMISIWFIRSFFWNQLKDYQKQRITTFWNPEADPLGSGYQIIQSKVAIGSGGLLGKGFLQGSQTQLRFLPEQHTDFIFAVIGEEFGFLGVLLTLAIFTVLLVRIVHASNIYRSEFSSVIGIGIATIIGFHMFVNVGMTIGLAPVTGLPLPFISYGGSALLSNLLMIGFLLNFYRHRYEY